ncbi:uncharacterized protein LOC143199501, partial [Rhynchophorus ferrugineus]|uniref:uncharacterized protein LOC143199501 n=1 Tax=Rhynchophorus ferrugineus TaxID=354439 RepID=UPI003FCD98C8
VATSTEGQVFTGKETEYPYKPTTEAETGYTKVSQETTVGPQETSSPLIYTTTGKVATSTEGQVFTGKETEYPYKPTTEAETGYTKVFQETTVGPQETSSPSIYTTTRKVATSTDGQVFTGKETEYPYKPTTEAETGYTKVSQETTVGPQETSSPLIYTTTGKVATSTEGQVFTGKETEYPYKPTTEAETGYTKVSQETTVGPQETSSPLIYTTTGKVATSTEGQVFTGKETEYPYKPTTEAETGYTKVFQETTVGPQETSSPSIYTTTRKVATSTDGQVFTGKETEYPYKPTTEAETGYTKVSQETTVGPQETSSPLIYTTTGKVATSTEGQVFTGKETEYPYKPTTEAETGYTKVSQETTVGPQETSSPLIYTTTGKVATSTEGQVFTGKETEYPYKPTTEAETGYTKVSQETTVAPQETSSPSIYTTTRKVATSTEGQVFTGKETEYPYKPTTEAEIGYTKESQETTVGPQETSSPLIYTTTGKVATSTEGQVFTGKETEYPYKPTTEAETGYTKVSQETTVGPQETPSPSIYTTTRKVATSTDGQVFTGKETEYPYKPTTEAETGYTKVSQETTVGPQETSSPLIYTTTGKVATSTEGQVFTGKETEYPYKPTTEAETGYTKVTQETTVGPQETSSPLIYTTTGKVATSTEGQVFTGKETEYPYKPTTEAETGYTKVFQETTVGPQETSSPSIYTTTRKVATSTDGQVFTGKETEYPYKPTTEAETGYTKVSQETTVGPQETSSPLIYTTTGKVATSTEGQVFTGKETEYPYKPTTEAETGYTKVSQETTVGPQETSSPLIYTTTGKVATSTEGQVFTGKETEYPYKPTTEAETGYTKVSQETTVAPQETSSPSIYTTTRKVATSTEGQVFTGKETEYPYKPTTEAEIGYTKESRETTVGPQETSSPLIYTTTGKVATSTEGQVFTGKETEYPYKPTTEAETGYTKVSQETTVGPQETSSPLTYTTTGKVATSTEGQVFTGKETEYPYKPTTEAEIWYTKVSQETTVGPQETSSPSIYTTTRKVATSTEGQVFTGKETEYPYKPTTEAEIGYTKVSQETTVGPQETSSPLIYTTTGKMATSTEGQVFTGKETEYPYKPTSEAETGYTKVSQETTVGPQETTSPLIYTTTGKVATSTEGQVFTGKETEYPYKPTTKAETGYTKVSQETTVGPQETSSPSIYTTTRKVATSTEGQVFTGKETEYPYKPTTEAEIGYTKVSQETTVGPQETSSPLIYTTTGKMAISTEGQVFTGKETEYPYKPTTEAETGYTKVSQETTVGPQETSSPSIYTTTRKVATSTEGQVFTGKETEYPYKPTTEAEIGYTKLSQETTVGPQETSSPLIYTTTGKVATSIEGQVFTGKETEYPYKPTTEAETGYTKVSQETTVGPQETTSPLIYTTTGKVATSTEGQVFTGKETEYPYKPTTEAETGYTKVSQETTLGPQETSSPLIYTTTGKVAKSTEGQVFTGKETEYPYKPTTEAETGYTKVSQETTVGPQETSSPLIYTTTGKVATSTEGQVFTGKETEYPYKPTTEAETGYTKVSQETTVGPQETSSSLIYTTTGKLATSTEGQVFTGKETEYPYKPTTEAETGYTKVSQETTVGPQETSSPLIYTTTAKVATSTEGQVFTGKETKYPYKPTTEAETGYTKVFQETTEKWLHIQRVKFLLVKKRSTHTSLPLKQKQDIPKYPKKQQLVHKRLPRLRYTLPQEK